MSTTEKKFDEFVEDFDSGKPVESIRFERNWAEGHVKKSRRLLGLPPPLLSHCDHIKIEPHQTEPDDIEDQPRRQYDSPKVGWDSQSRRAVQYGFNLLQRPAQFVNGVDQWRGPQGVVAKLMEYACLTGNRARKNVKEILLQCVENSEGFDAGNRSQMQRPRKRKLSSSDVNFAGKMLRRGTGSKWAATYVNNKRIRKDGVKPVDRRTLMRTLKRKYDAKCHRRQTKSTGSKNKKSLWATSRLAIGKQFLHQLKLGKLFFRMYAHVLIH